MLKAISFGSTFKVNNRANKYDKFSQFQKFAQEKELEDDIQVGFKDKLICKNRFFELFYHKQTYTMIVPDSLDEEIETYCYNHGIKFDKISNKNLMNSKRIDSRIEKPQENLKKVYIDSEKLEELIENQKSNIRHCEKDYREYYASKVDYALKSADPIPATFLYIETNDSTIEDSVNYINRYGIKGLNPNQLIINFHQKTDNGDHCIYFALRDLGMKNIPIYIDDNSYRIANALGIVSDTNS